MEKTFPSQRLFNFSNWIIGGLFFSLYLILSLHSRLASDDFYYISLLNNYGAWKGMIFQYEQWSGRWTAHYLACLLLKFRNSLFFLPFVNIGTLLILFFSLKTFLSNTCKRFFPGLNDSIQLSLTLIFLVCFFFTTYDISETWFWYIIIITYLWSIIAFIILLNSIFTDSKPFTNLFGIILSSAFIGGASESFALIFIFLIAAILSYKLFKLKENIKKQTSIRLIFALIILISSLLFSVFAPGTSVRYSLLPHPSIIEKLWIAVKAFIKYFVRFLPGKILFLILFSFPWFFAGSVNTIKIQHLDFAKRILKLTMLFIVLIAIFFIPTTFVLSETGPGRALSIVSLATTFYFAILFFMIGQQFSRQRKLIAFIFLGCFIFSVSYILKTIKSQSTIVKNFAFEYDKRMIIIDSANKDNYQGNLILEKLPEHGFLYSEELSPDTSYFVNKHLKAGLQLPFSVSVE
jgi:hypothetical protein